eukprot:scpid105262/ scgid21428/ 
MCEFTCNRDERRNETWEYNNDPQPAETKTCNCRSKPDCPMNGQCLNSGIVYHADVNADTAENKFYYGLTENTFKQRYNSHLTTFRHGRYEKSTELSKHV